MRIETSAYERCYELIALSESIADKPGAVHRSASGAPERLHFAPRRWLLPEASPEQLQALGEPVASGAIALVDVSGKWHRLSLRGSDVSQVLNRGIAVDAVMGDRDCAAFTLFDCPVVLCRAADGFDLWVHSSYAGALRASLEAASTHCTAA